ncbi:MAG: DUF3617 domain-containing protein [Burkholderiales bacterium]|nr:DUF3617 domain-containing protein [Burkholderiales bacterium]
MPRFASLLLAAAAALPAAAVAADALPPVKPGLWEMQVRSPELDQMRAQMQAQMAKMSPAQRAQMEAMMGQAGFGVGPGGTTRVCITPEMVKQAPMSVPDKCKGSWQVKGRLVSFEYTCQDGTQGRGETHYGSDTAFSGWIESASPRGKQRIENSGRWVAADCGNVKPLPPVK